LLDWLQHLGSFIVCEKIDGTLRQIHQLNRGQLLLTVHKGDLEQFSILLLLGSFLLMIKYLLLMNIETLSLNSGCLCGSFLILGQGYTFRNTC